MLDKKKYQVCSRCIMDTSAQDIVFDNEGICNFCQDFIENAADVLHGTEFEKNKNLNSMLSKIRKSGGKKKYDCIVGVSGGVDSSWVLVKAVEFGLRPLAVHMDNGWNSELAQNNIANLVNGLGVDLYTYVIDWSEYKKLMQSFFDADVIDIELLYDNAMLAVNYQLASRFGVKYILSGHNKATEGMSIPEKWNWFKFDKKNIKVLAKKFSKLRIKTFPAIGTLEYIWFKMVRRIKWTSILDLMEYNKFEVMDELQKRFKYKPYPYKHYESIFTRFYQGYILPNKFNVDKRRVHLSTLIMSGQIRKEEALKIVEEIAYPSEQEMNEDILYFKKKMDWSDENLQEYLSRPEKSHENYGSEKKLWKFLGGIYKNVTGNTEL